MEENKGNPYLSVVIPAYNEERRITTTLLSLYEYLSRQPFTCEIIVALDGPDDGTQQMVQEFASKRQNIRWI